MTTTAQRLKVRCCCNPMLVLGTLPVPDVPTGPHRGDRFHYPIRGRASWVTLEVATASDEVIEVDPEPPYEHRRTWVKELALKSDDTPLEVLRQIPGFEEINRVQPIGEVHP